MALRYMRKFSGVRSRPFSRARWRRLQGLLKNSVGVTPWGMVRGMRRWGVVTCRGTPCMIAPPGRGRAGWWRMPVGAGGCSQATGW